MSSLAEYVDHKVTVITTDGRMLIGLLKAYDKSTNLVLSQTQERVITPTQEDKTDSIDLGVYMIRGESVACCGLVDEEMEESINWSNVVGKALISTKHAT